MDTQIITLAPCKPLRAQDMKHGAGQKESFEGSEGDPSGGAGGERIVPEGGAAASKGG